MFETWVFKPIDGKFHERKKCFICVLLLIHLWLAVLVSVSLKKEQIFTLLENSSPT